MGGVEAAVVSQPDRASADRRPDPDAPLMEKVRAGDRDAFRELYEKHRGGVVRYAAGFTHSSARAEELAQDVFLQVYRARQRWEPRARVTTWLYAIAHNVCLNEVRRFDYRGKVGSLDGPDGNPIDFEDGEAVAGHEAVSVGELQERVRALLAELPESQRSALLLSRVQDLRYEAIGEVLGCTEQAVKSLIFRATRRLREGLKEWIQDER